MKIAIECSTRACTEEEGAAAIDAAIRDACERQRESDRLHAMKLDIETVIYTNDVQRLAYQVKCETVVECRDCVGGLLAMAPLVCE